MVKICYKQIAAIDGRSCEVGMKIVLKASVVFLVMMVLAVGTANAAPVLIRSITNSVSAPSRVALDAMGNVYVAETEAGLVNKYNSKGGKIGAFRVFRPYGIAVRPGGEVLVCSVQMPSKANNYVNKSAVFVYSPALVKTGTLGAAEGEFEAPVDIAIDKDGAVYVSDMRKGVVRVYDALGVFQYSIGSGYLRADWTQGVAVSDSANNGAGEVYVVDTAPAMVQGYQVDVPRVTVFSKTGTVQRSFGQYGTEAGSMVSPRGIAVDRDGILYVADSGNNVVHIMSAADGSLVGEGGLYAAGTYRPGGVAVSSSKVAYVAWQSGRVDAFGLDGYVAMAASPASLAFTAVQYAGNPPAQTVVVSNAGTGTLNWSASADQPWVSVGAQAAVAPAGSVDLSVGVDASSLSAGAHQATVTLLSEFGEQSVITVDLAVSTPKMLNISNWSPSFTVGKGGTASQSVVVSIDGGTGTWSVSSASLPSWLSLSPLSGTEAPTTAVFTVNAAGLNTQTAPYVATVPISAPGVVGDGSNRFTVSLTVAPATSLTVSTNLSDATFRVSGPAEYTGSGTDWSVNNAPVGDYTVTFDGVAGYRKPHPQTKALAEDGTVLFTGTYVSYQELAAKKNIVAAKGPDAANDASVKLFKNNGSAVAFDLVALGTTFGADVAVGDVDGDGAADIIVGTGRGQNNPATVRIFRAADKSMLDEFTPFGTLNGAGVAAGDIDGDGKAEVLVSDNISRIRVCSYRDGRMVSTGITIPGIAATVADTAYDGRPEVVTVSPQGTKIWDVDLAGGTATRLLNRVNLTGSSVAAGDFDGDGDDELLIGGLLTAAGRVSVSVVEPFGGRRTLVTLNRASAAVAAADLDGDGIAEAVIGTPDEATSGSTLSDQKRPTVHVYGADGVRKFAFRPFPDDEAKYGITIAVGDLGQ